MVQLEPLEEPGLRPAFMRGVNLVSSLTGGRRQQTRRQRARWNPERVPLATGCQVSPRLHAESVHLALLGHVQNLYQYTSPNRRMHTEVTDTGCHVDRHTSQLNGKPG